MASEGTNSKAVSSFSVKDILELPDTKTFNPENSSSLLLPAGTN